MKLSSSEGTEFIQCGERLEAEKISHSAQHDHGIDFDVKACLRVFHVVDSLLLLHLINLSMQYMDIR
jgi:hypothetical protein